MAGAALGELDVGLPHRLKRCAGVLGVRSCSLAQERAEVFEGLTGDRTQQLVLVREMQIQRGRRDAGARGDGPDRQALRAAVLEQQLRGGLHQRSTQPVALAAGVALAGVVGELIPGERNSGS